MPGSSLLRRRVRRAAVPAALVPAMLLVTSAALAGGCGSSGGPLTVGPDQNGQTLTSSVGQRVVVTLTGANWQFDLTPPFGALTETATHLRSGRTSTSTADFVGRIKGTATVHATRAKCGGRPCPAGQGEFTVHITVSS